MAKPASNRNPGSGTRQRVTTALILLLTAAGVVLAAIGPAWLVDPLRRAVLDAGPAAPLLYLLLCVVAAPLHLSGVVVALSTVTWPLPVAAALSFTGTLLGCVLTAVAVTRRAPDAARLRSGWPGWLQRAAAGVSRRPVPIGILVRVVLAGGLAVEAFFVVTGYNRRRYLLSTSAGIALWTAQNFLGIAALAALVKVSPLLAAPTAITLPIASLGVAVLVRRRRALRRAASATDEG